MAEVTIQTAEQIRQEQMVADLTSLLTQAKAGKLTSLAFVALTDDQLFYRAISDGTMSQLQIIGALCRLKSNIDDQMYEQELNDADLDSMIESEHSTEH